MRAMGEPKIIPCASAPANLAFRQTLQLKRNRFRRLLAADLWPSIRHSRYPAHRSGLGLRLRGVVRLIGLLRSGLASPISVAQIGGWAGKLRDSPS